MRMPSFDLFTPSTQAEAVSLLHKHPEAKIMAGGTDLLVSMKQGLIKPKQLISMRLIPDLAGIEKFGNGGLRMGSMVRLSSVAKSVEVRKRYPTLSDTARLIGVPPLQNVATVGGNLSLDTRCLYYNQSIFWHQGLPACFKMGGDVCHVVKGSDKCWAVFQADLPPILIALGANVTVEGPQGERIMPLRKLYSGRGERPLALEQGELIAGIELPPPEKGMGASYLKLRLRAALDFPLVSTAATIWKDNGVCKDARLVLGAIASKPVTIEIGNVLRGKNLKDGIVEAAELAFEAAHPVANVGATPLYRRKMVRVLVQRALQRAWEQAGR